MLSSPWIFLQKRGMLTPSKQRKVIVMKSRRTLCLCLAVIAVIAVFSGALGLYRNETARQDDVDHAENQIYTAQSLAMLARSLNAEQTVYTAAGEPIRSEYDESIFTAGLYEIVDAYREENRLYQGVAALASQPELRGRLAAGETYLSICETAVMVYQDEIRETNAAAHQTAVRCGTLLGLGLAALALTAVLLVRLERAFTAEEQDDRRGHHTGRPLPHMG